MGQKVKPNLFRLISNQNPYSIWYEDKLKYSVSLKEDVFLRSEIYKVFNQFILISKITISKSNNIIYLNLKCLSIQEKDINLINKKEKIKFLNKENFKDIFVSELKEKIRFVIHIIQKKLNKKCFINFIFIENLYKDSDLIALHIKTLIEKRIPFRKILKQIITKIQIFENIIGIKIQLSGRLNGIDIARTEWEKFGKIPLHSLSNKINYSISTAKTIYGIVGIKVWLHFKDVKFLNSN